MSCCNIFMGGELGQKNIFKFPLCIYGEPKSVVCNATGNMQGLRSVMDVLQGDFPSGLSRPVIF